MPEQICLRLPFFDKAKVILTILENVKRAAQTSSLIPYLCYQGIDCLHEFPLLPWKHSYRNFEDCHGIYNPIKLSLEEVEFGVILLVWLINIDAKLECGTLIAGNLLNILALSRL